MDYREERYEDGLDFSPERIRLIRAMLKLNQEKFAKRYGFSENIVARWETGDAVPTQARTINGLLKAAKDAGA